MSKDTIPKCPYCWTVPAVKNLPTQNGTETFIICSSAGTRERALAQYGCFNRPMGSGENLEAALKDYIHLTSHARAEEYNRRKKAGEPL